MCVFTAESDHTCRVAQSDLQCGTRNEPAELEGVLISMRVGGAWDILLNTHTRGVRIIVRTNPIIGAVVWRVETHHFLLELVALSVDEDHGFLEHW